ncbi:cell division protein FtsQ/DivIB [Nakamurella sp.]|uniref:cell division protein FtsQ/DivIB n=1 Tax=Nakamurella sp. TaxID=1869182 RepID=UPI00378341FE
MSTTTDAEATAQVRGRRSRRGAASEPKTFPGRRRRRWPWIVAFVTVLALVAAAVYAVFFSPLLAVKSVTITGSDEALNAQVRSVVPDSVGIPLARVNLDAVAASAQTVPEVADVVVAREWPDTLRITVTPRVPTAVTSANGQLWLLDADGDPYLTVASVPAGLVTVQLAAPGRTDPATKAALAVVESLTPDFKPQVAVLSARTEFDIELTLIDRKKVIWGEPTQSAQKMQMLPALLAARDGTEYDISDPTLVTVR